MPTKTNMKVLISRTEIADAVARIGQEITRDFAGESVILVGVLKGACLFLSDLARQIELTPHLISSPCAVTARKKKAPAKSSSSRT